MCMRVSIHEAKAYFSKLLSLVASGAEIEIARGDTLVARLVPARVTEPRSFGVARGQFVVPDDFDTPLSDEELDIFE